MTFIIFSFYSYNPITGKFLWKITKSGIKKDKKGIAGCVDSQGYWIVRIKGKNYKGHRLAWLIV